MDSRRAALAPKPSQPQHRTDRLHWECRCCVRPRAPLMEFFEEPAGRRAARVRTTRRPSDRLGVLIPAVCELLSLASRAAPAE